MMAVITLKSFMPELTHGERCDVERQLQGAHAAPPRQGA
jgi:hypothetical protein